MRVKCIDNCKTLDFGEIYTVDRIYYDRFKNVFGEWEDKDKYCVMGEDGVIRPYKKSRFVEVGE